MSRHSVIVLLIFSFSLSKSVASDRPYIVSIGIGGGYGKVLQLPMDASNIPKEKDKIGALGFELLTGYNTIRNKLLAHLLYLDHATPDKPENDFTEDMLITSMIGTHDFYKTNKMCFSGSVGYAAFIFKSTSLLNSSIEYRKSGYAPTIGFGISIRPKEADPTKLEPGKILSTFFNISYDYVNSEQTLHIIKFSILPSVSKNRYGMFNFRYVYHNKLYKIIVFTFGGYGFIG